MITGIFYGSTTGNTESAAQMICAAISGSHVTPIHDAALEAGATIVGKCSGDGYEFQESAAFIDGRFLGLPLDEENQADLTEERIRIWVDQVLQEAK